MGVKETKLKGRWTNWGPKVSMYLASAGIYHPAAWCAAFVTWCLLEAGAKRKNLPLLAASTYYWYEWANKNKRLLSQPHRGDVFVVNGANGGHEGWVRASSDAFINTIEGNTNDEGSRDGFEVCERERQWARYAGQFPRQGFINVDGLDK